MALSKIKGTVIADDAINADRIADGTVVASDLLDNTLTGAKLATDIAITTSGNITTTGAFTSTGIDDNATSTAITIDSSERVGIGTSNPSADLHISGSASTLQLTDEANSHSYQWQAANDRFEIRDVTNTVERFTLLPSGNIGIGTTAPSEILDVRGSATMLQYDTGSGTGPAIQQYHNSVSPADNDIIGRIRFFGNDSGGTKTSFAEIKALSTDVTDTSEDGALTFFTINSGSLSERMRIDSSGNVGIGTSSPDADLTISSGGGEMIHLISSHTNKSWVEAEAGNGSMWRLGTVDSNPHVRLEAMAVTGEIKFLTGGANERMRIDDSGNVGIGTSSPASKLEVEDSVNGDMHLRINNTNTGNTARTLLLLESDGATGSLYLNGANRVSSGVDEADSMTLTSDASASNGLNINATSGSIKFYYNYLEKMRIDSSGNVSIGKSSSAGKSLEIYASTNAAMRIQNSTTGTTGSDGLLIEMGGSDVLIYNYENGVMKFGTNNAERMRIDSSGNFMVNRTSALDAGKVSLSYAGASQRGICIETDTTASTAQMRFVNPNGGVGEILTSGSSTTYATSSDHRLKENVIDLADATTRVKQLQPKRFNFIADADTTVDGFLAHEVSDIVPEAITGTKDEVDAEGNPVYQGIDQSKLVPLLTASLKEAINKIEQLEARISALET